MIKLVSENSGSYIYINYHSFILVFKIDNVFRRFKCIFIYVMYARGGFFMKIHETYSVYLHSNILLLYFTVISENVSTLVGDHNIRLR